MKLFRTTLAVLVNSLLALQLSAQSHPEQPEENWLRELNLYSNEQFLYMRYDRYTRDDITNFKTQVAKVRAASTKDKWEGTYWFDFPDSVTYSLMSWKSSGGYFGLSVYTCLPELRSLRYGRAEATDESVTFVSEKLDETDSSHNKYIKVRWGHRRYLVNEKSLLAFTQKAAGLYVEPDDGSNEKYQLWSDYWVASEDENDPTPKGLPVLPLRYRHLERKPLSARISNVAKPSIQEDIEFGNRVFSGPSAVYPITLSSGSSTGLAPGMILVNLKTSEEIFVKTVSSTSSKGILVRSLDDGGKEHCIDENGEKLRCPTLSFGTSFTTKVGSFWW
ncbi:MAG TPA: hypothetical protein VFZ49_10595 [Pyrinomonadaceae bacterium]